MITPIEQLKSLLPLWKDSKSSYADDSFLGEAVRKADIPAIIESLERQLAEANKDNL